MAKSPISIEVKGLSKVEKFLDRKDKQVMQKVKEGITKSAIFLQGEVKMSIAGRKAEFPSVDTGRFLNSVDFKVGNFDASVFSLLPYARKLEFGTSFKNSPRRHFTNSAARNKLKVADIIEQEIKKIKN